MDKYEYKIHFGYGIENEGTKEQRIIPLVGRSLRDLENQARYFKLRLRREDYVSLQDIEDFADEVEFDIHGDDSQ